MIMHGTYTHTQRTKEIEQPTKISNIKAMPHRACLAHKNVDTMSTCSSYSHTIAKVAHSLESQSMCKFSRLKYPTTAAKMSNGIHINMTVKLGGRTTDIFRNIRRKKRRKKEREMKKRNERGGGREGERGDMFIIQMHVHVP